MNDAMPTIAAMDSIVVLDGSTIAKIDRHAALLALVGLYASLWARQ
ncbi:hypothetical protein ACEN2J_07870 [Pseudorhodobacter sp. W20_MBD10_FR17]